MTDQTQIIKAGLGDVPVLAGLIRDAYRDVAQRFNLTPENCPKHPSNCTPKWIRKDFARSVSYFILEHNQEPVGCAALEKPTSDLGYLERLAVLPAQRRRGFGQMLVDYVFEQARNSGLKKISIGIIAEQTDLLWWYRKIGFVEGDTREFEHLPFLVTFMMYQLPGRGADLNPD
jgi:ribosomal protein S18 acetylase RimI-like enzyme